MDLTPRPLVIHYEVDIAVPTSVLQTPGVDTSTLESRLGTAILGTALAECPPGTTVALAAAGTGGVDATVPDPE